MLFFLSLQINFKSSHANSEVIISYSLLEELLHLANVLLFKLLKIVKLLFLHFYCVHESVDVIILVIEIVLIVLLVFLDVGLLGLLVFNHKLFLKVCKHSIIRHLELIDVSIAGELDFLPDNSKI